MDKEIVIQDVGPITDFRFAVRRGMNVLRGKNGVGKTTIIEVAKGMVTGHADVAPRDGAPRGRVEGLGVTLTIAGQNRRRGELEFESIEGRFSLVDLVDPQIKEEGAADAKRIKALIQLAGGPSAADPSLFYKLLGGQEAFTANVSPGTATEKDLVNMAGRVKRDLEKKARELEEQAEREVIASESDRKALEGVNITVPCDALQLQEDLEQAVADKAALEAKAKAALEAQTKAKQATMQLKIAEAANAGESVALAEAAEQIAKRTLADADDAVEAARAALQRAKEAQASARLRHEAAVEALEAARSRDSLVQAWRASVVAGEVVETVTQEDLAAAAERVTKAREAIELGSVARLAKKRLETADEHAREAARLRTKADKLRDAGRATDEVLSDYVAKLGCPLKVLHGRLVTTTDRGEELFSELSRGEQWKLALDIAIEAVGPNGIIFIDQEGWEGIDPINRELIAGHCFSKDAVGLTAAVDEGELRAEVYEGSQAA